MMMMKNEPSKPETAFDTADSSFRLLYLIAFNLLTLITTNKKMLHNAENASVVNNMCKPAFKVSSFKGRMHRVVKNRGGNNDE